MTEYKIRKIMTADMPDVMEIEREAFTVPWSLDSYLAQMKNQWAHYLVCQHQRRVIGYVGTWVVFEEAHITNLAVHVSFRAQGIGRALLLAVEDIIRAKAGTRVLLEVRPSNTAALRLYQSLNYYEVARRAEYYQDNQEEAIVMRKNLDFTAIKYV